MSLLIDMIFVLRELYKLSYVVLTSPLALFGAFLLLGNNNI